MYFLDLGNEGSIRIFETQACGPNPQTYEYLEGFNLVLMAKMSFILKMPVILSAFFEAFPYVHNFPVRLGIFDDSYDPQW